MESLNLLGASHIIVVILCVLGIVYIPKFFTNSSESAKTNLAYVIILLIFVNQSMDLYFEGYLGGKWKLGLPLHLCDFSSFSIVIYLITKQRAFFLFAFFFGIAGGGMSILTPDVLFGFPDIFYIQNQIGHMMIILGVSYGMILDNQRPYLGDVHRVLIFTSILLVIMYGINYLLGHPANYWFLIEKPIGDNLMSLMRPEPFHIIDLYFVAVAACYLLYTPFYIQDKRAKQ